MLGSQKGQTLLIVVLVMIIALSVGLATVARTITNIKVATDSSNSQKAFEAAEAGLEEVLGSTSNVGITSPQSFGGAIINGVTVQQIVGTNATGGTFYFLENNGLAINQDDGTDVWLSQYNANPNQRYQNPWSGNLNIYWGTSSNGCNNSALEIMIISGSRTNPIFKKYAVDPCNLRVSHNSFTSATSTNTNIQGVNFYYVAQISNVNSGLIARITPLYGSTPIAISATNPNSFPSQGRVITSSATVSTSTRKIVFFQGYDSIPSEFFYSLFSIQ